MTAVLEDVDPLRRRITSAVRGRDTKPEMVVRHLLHSMKYRYTLHRKDLPGRPEIVFSRRRKVVFVHGCFWHRHEVCMKATQPKTRADFWAEKFERNKERDWDVEDRLKEAGWSSLVVWECETRSPEELSSKLREFLSEPSMTLVSGRRSR
jgi:DNA mismatch endonuclease (patch repair protein)